MKKKKLNFDLKAFAANVTVDVFGYEKVINQNASHFLESYGQRLKTEKDKIQLWIKSDENLTCLLVIPQDQKQAIKIEELTGFFTGRQVSKEDPYCRIVENGISKFIREYCQKWQFDIKNICFTLAAQQIIH